MSRCYTRHDSSLNHSQSAVTSGQTSLHGALAEVRTSEAVESLLDCSVLG